MATGKKFKERFFMEKHSIRPAGGLEKMLPQDFSQQLWITFPP
jgi:hypothetical protein